MVFATEARPGGYRPRSGIVRVSKSRPRSHRRAGSSASSHNRAGFADREGPGNLRRTKKLAVSDPQPAV